MIGLHMTSVYTLPGLDRATLEAQEDALEDALMELEEADPSVTDSTVSVDYGECRVEVEVFVIGEDFDDAKKHAHRRVKEAIAKMTHEVSQTSETSERVAA